MNSHILGLVLTVFIGIEVIAFGYIAPYVSANQYLTDLSKSSEALKKDFETLAKSTSSSVFDSPDTDPLYGRLQLENIARTIDRTRTDLKQFDNQANTFPESGPLVISGAFARAKVTRNEAKDIVAQSSDVLTDYEQLVTYAVAVNAARIIYEQNINTINAYSDLNALIGKSYVTIAMEEQVQSAAAKLAAANPPSQMKASQAGLTETFHQTAQGLGELSRGLAAASDSRIGSGIMVVEEASTRQYPEEINKAFEVMVSSVVLKDVSELPEKLEQF